MRSKACRIGVSDGLRLTGAPVLLHASLAPTQAMSSAVFMVALQQWQGVLPCSIEGAGGTQGCLYESSSDDCSDDEDSWDR